MSAHLLLFSESFPETFEKWQSILDELSIPLIIQEKGKINYSAPFLTIRTSVKASEHIESIECYPMKVEDLNNTLKSLIFDKVGTRNLVLDFTYSSRGCAESLGLGLALMKEHYALCYVDFMSYGFIDFEEAKKGFEKELATINY